MMSPRFRLARFYSARTFSPKVIGIAVGAIILIVGVGYFWNVGFFSRLLSREQSAQIAEQEGKIAGLEEKIKRAEGEKDVALRRAREADRRADAAMVAVSEERRKVQLWAAKYAEIKNRPRDLVDTVPKARDALREMGWLK